MSGGRASGYRLLRRDLRLSLHRTFENPEQNLECDAFPQSGFRLDDAPEVDRRDAVARLQGARMALRDIEDISGAGDRKRLNDIGERVHAAIATRGSDFSQHGT